MYGSVDLGFDARSNKILTPILSSLGDYWKIKGMFIRANSEPDFIKTNGGVLYNAILDFLEK
jgi:hypothetical protein